MEETQSTVISSTVEESEPAPAVVEAVSDVEKVTKSMKITNRPTVLSNSFIFSPATHQVEVTSVQEMAEPRLVESPVSDSATIGSEVPALVITGTAIGVATAAVAKAKSPAAKKPIASVKKTTTSSVKPASSPAAKPAAKELAKKPEPTARYVDIDNMITMQ